MMTKVQREYLQRVLESIDVAQQHVVNALVAKDPDTTGAITKLIVQVTGLQAALKMTLFCWEPRREEK